MRILIVGTAFPLRGGIAHAIALIAKSLRERGNWVHVMTFSRQYPKLLFPGKSQDEAPIKNDELRITGEDENESLRNSQVIDTINPVSWYRAGRIAASYKPDLIVFKYWMPFFAPAYGVLARVAKRITRKQGHECKIAFIVDNVIPHEKRPGDMMLTRFAFRAVDAYIVQSDSVERELLQVVPNAKYVKVLHPVFENFGQRVDRTGARAALGIPKDAPTILFFGYIRKYKGLDILLRAMPLILKKLPELRLVIAGEFYGDEAEYRKLIEELQIPSNNLVLATDYIANDEVAKYFSASNAVVLPYRDATQSGIVLIAYNFDTPAIVTDVGGLAEVVPDGVSGLIVPKATPEAVAKRVLEFFAQDLEAKLMAGVAEQKKKYSWDAFAEGIESLVNL
ncbi:MAG: glycosyltransferase [Bacteroidota bacterium]|nr:glycosyltransferase [Bacteroidota bacterium]MDP4234080.1 glycosyltransferase [Bacteroidota bacterium]MDP4243021.1 glycosyltransferase [Bacteroidota bacterium]MDP4287447.1 glycosyltransferase [Bacteroidota bacterium]